jgi:hypothetical protein
MRVEGRLFNADGEFIASGPCEINRDRAEVTMWPAWETRVLDRERGRLTLALEGGETLEISDRHLTFRLRGPTEERISVFRLRVLGRVDRVPEHLRTGFEARDNNTQAPAEPNPGGTPVRTE